MDATTIKLSRRRKRVKNELNRVKTELDESEGEDADSN